MGTDVAFKTNMACYMTYDEACYFPAISPLMNQFHRLHTKRYGMLHAGDIGSHRYRIFTDMLYHIAYLTYMACNVAAHLYGGPARPVGSTCTAARPGPGNLKAGWDLYGPPSRADSDVSCRIRRRIPQFPGLTASGCT